MEGQRLGYRLDASTMSGRLRRRPAVDMAVDKAAGAAATVGYSKRCQRDLDRFYNMAVKDAENHFSSQFQLPRDKKGAAVQTASTGPSFRVLKSSPLTLPPEIDALTAPVKTKRIIRKQRSLSYAQIRHSCHEVLHLSIDCHSPSGEDNNSNTDTARSSQPRVSSKKPRLSRRRPSAEKRVKFKKSPRSNSESERQPLHMETLPHRANYLLQRNQGISEKRDKEHLNELFHTKTGEMERDVQGFVRLNYTLVGKYLGYENSSYKHKLLQALRWRLNLNEKLTQRTLQDFLKYDLLRIKNNQYYEKSIIETLLWPPRHATHANHIQNSMARLLNGIVSYEEGRRYVGSTSIVNHLMWGGETEAVYKVEPSRQFLDSNTAGMLVATMMKLSTSSWQKRDMMNKGVLRWTLSHLEDIEYSGGVFQTKYTLALLNSLLKLPEAIDELNTRTAQVLVLLSRYLRKEKNEWLFTVKSILVKLFKHKPFRQAAKEMNFETLLRKLINPLDFKAKREIEFIILYLNDCGNITQLPCSASLFEVEESIVFDPEIESGDEIAHLPGLEGELLLEEQFAKYKIVYETPPLEVVDRKSNHVVETIFTKGESRNTLEYIASRPEDRMTEKPWPKDDVQERPPEVAHEPSVEDVIAANERASEITEEINALKLCSNYQVPVEVEEEGSPEVNVVAEAAAAAEQDDNNDVVIGKLDEEETSTVHELELKTAPVTVRESVLLSGSSTLPPSDPRTFPHSLSMSSSSSLDGVIEPAVWSEFPKGRRIRNYQL